MAYLVASLDALRAEVNARYPNRDKASDGWIGDPANQQTNSDHNPDFKGAVHALDLDEDLDGNPADAGAEILWLANYLRTKRDPRIKYVIYEAQIFASYSTTTRKAWEWGPYSGSTNMHRKHMHVSVLSTDVGENSTIPWLPPLDAPPPPPKDDDDMPYLMWHATNGAGYLITDHDVLVLDPVTFSTYENAGFKVVRPSQDLDDQIVAVTRIAANQRAEMIRLLGEVSTKLDEISTGEGGVDAAVIESTVRKVFADAGQE